MTDEVTLKPCPFCGSADVEMRETITDAQVCCNNCGSRTGLVYLGSSEQANAYQIKMARTAWNTRTTTAVPNGVVEALGKRIQQLNAELLGCGAMENEEVEEACDRVRSAFSAVRHSTLQSGQTAPAGDVVEALKAACTALENRKVLVDMVLDASAEQGRKVLAALTAAKSRDAELLREAWAKRTGTVEVTGETVPHLKIHFDNKEDMRSFDDALRTHLSGETK